MSPASHNLLPPLPIKPERPASAGEIWNTRWFLAAFYLLAFLWGVRNIWFWTSSRVDVLHPLVLNLCLAIWAINDARYRRHPVPMLSQSWFLLLGLIVVPTYFIWSRGPRGIPWVLLHLVGWYAVVAVVMIGGGAIASANGWLQAVGR